MLKKTINNGELVRVLLVYFLEAEFLVGPAKINGLTQLTVHAGSNIWWLLTAQQVSKKYLFA